MISDKQIILFDGICNLCNNIVIFIINRDTDNKFQFASIQSQSGKTLWHKHNLPIDLIDSFVLIKNEKVYFKSTAGLHVLRELGGVWKLCYLFIIIPTCMRDIVYNYIAKVRYKTFGKRDRCMVPTDDLKDRFLEE